MNQVTDNEEFDYTRTVIFSPEVTGVNLFPSDILSKKIAKLEQEAAIRMAIDTFLDCSADKVKVSNRIPKSPRSARMLKVK
jgi:hypothetical protein